MHWTDLGAGGPYELCSSRIVLCVTCCQAKASETSLPPPSTATKVERKLKPVQKLENRYLQIVGGRVTVRITKWQTTKMKTVSKMIHVKN